MVQLCRIQDDPNKVNGIVFKKTADYPLVIRKAVQVIDPRQVDDLNSITAKDNTGTQEINGHARPVTDAR